MAMMMSLSEGVGLEGWVLGDLQRVGIGLSAFGVSKNGYGWC